MTNFVENQALSHLGESDCSNKTSTIERNSLQSLPGGAKDQYVPRDAWGRCDDCHQWRRIPATLADLIGDPNYKW